MKDRIEISTDILPKNDDYIRGHCLYKLEGYIQPKYVIYDENLESFKKESKIYKFGKSVLKENNLDDKIWTLKYIHELEWCSYLQLVKINKNEII